MAAHPDESWDRSYATPEQVIPNTTPIIEGAPQRPIRATRLAFQAPDIPEDPDDQAGGPMAQGPDNDDAPYVSDRSPHG